MSKKISFLITIEFDKAPKQKSKKALLKLVDMQNISDAFANLPEINEINIDIA